ncbi:MAG: site-specific integrase [Chitinophagales bacterium]|nr:site-specific integrase [Chitinophagales bacterium]
MPEVVKANDLTEEMLVLFFKRIQTRQRIVGHCTKEGVKTTTILTYWNKLSVFFNWLERRGYLTSNPLSKIRQPNNPEFTPKELSKEAIRKIYSAITLYSHNVLLLRRDLVMLSLLLFCGIRRRELLSLECGDIDLDKLLISIRGQTSKSKRMRHIPIHPTLQIQLNDFIEIRKKSKYTTQFFIVSANRDRGLTSHGLKHWVDSLSKKSGVKFHLHQFRHTFATSLAKKNVNAVKIQKLLGHNSLDMTLTYLRGIQTRDLQKDISKLMY